MSRAFVYTSVVVIVALVQAAWLARAQVLGAALDPLLPLAVGMGILRGAESGAMFASGLFERSIYIENPLLPAIATFVGTLLGEVLLVIVALVVGLGVPSTSALVAKMIMQAILNSAIAPLLFRGIRAIETRLQREH